MQFPAKQTIPGEHHWHRQWSYTLTTAASFETVCAMNADPWIPCGSSASLVLLNQSSLVLVLFPSFYYCCCPYPTWFIHFAQVLFPSCCFRIYKGDTYFPKLIHMPLLKVFKKKQTQGASSLYKNLLFIARHPFLTQGEHLRTGYFFGPYFSLYIQAPSDWHQFLTVQTDFLLLLLFVECQQVTTHAPLMLFNSSTGLIQIRI